jgi:hypothetical protein
MPTPLHFTDEEMSLLINLSGPIAPAARPAFMQEVAQELEAAGQGGIVGGCIGLGAWFSGGGRRGRYNVAKLIE